MILLRKISFWLALAGVASAAFLAAQTQREIDEPRRPPPVTPAVKPFARGLGASGLVEARRENTAVGVPLAALVQQVHVAVWDQVEPGAPLLQLDDRELLSAAATQRVQLQVATARLATARASLRRVLDNLARLERLRTQDVVAEDELETRRNDAAIAEAQLATAEAERQAALAALAHTETLLARLTVRAPIGGTILQVNVRAGEYVTPGGATPPIVLGDLSELQVRADIDEQVAPRVRPGAAAIGYLKGDTTNPIPLSFVRIEPFVIPKRSLTGASTERVDTRVLQVIYRFPASPTHRIYVGQQLDLFIEE